MSFGDDDMAADEASRDATTDPVLLAAERDAWRETAEQETRNAAYYRGLVDAIASKCGPDAYTDDTGQRHDSPLRDKVPEVHRALVHGLNDRVDALAAALDAVATAAEMDRDGCLVCSANIATARTALAVALPDAPPRAVEPARSQRNSENVPLGSPAPIGPQNGDGARRVQALEAALREIAGPCEFIGTSKCHDDSEWPCRSCRARIALAAPPAAATPDALPAAVGYECRPGGACVFGQCRAAGACVMLAPTQRPRTDGPAVPPLATHDPQNCPNNRAPGGCHLPNVHCQAPACFRRVSETDGAA